MHGAGNDFVLVDCRQDPASLSPELVRRLCDRRLGVGCDQLITIEPPRSEGAAFAYGIWNQDGSPAGQCGNGARCAVAWARRAGVFTGPAVRADSPSGMIEASIDADGSGIEVELGCPDFADAAVGFLDDGRPREIEHEGQRLPFTCVSMGNPHAVVEVVGLDAAPVHAVGASLQRDPRFAAGVNVGFAEVLDRRQVRLRVFERGVGETLACGSGACAAVAALRRAGRLDARVTVRLPGGALEVTWPGEGRPVRLRGPATFVFEGEWCE